MASSFKDTAGREWVLKFTARRLTELRKLLGFSISIIATPEGVAEWKGPEVARNPERFSEVLAVLLADQFTAAGVTLDQFEEAFDETTYRDAAGAFIAALLNFSLVPAALMRLYAGEEGETSGRESPLSNGPTNSPEAPESIPGTTASTN